MKKFEFPKIILESKYPPRDKNMLWVDIEEGTGRVKSLKEFNSNNIWEDATDIISTKAGGVKPVEISISSTGVPQSSEELNSIKKDGVLCVKYNQSVSAGFLYGTITTEVETNSIVQTAYIPYIDTELEGIEVAYLQRTFSSGTWSSWGIPE